MLILALATAPGIAIALYIYWRDHHDREPVHLLVKCFVLGALSIIPAVLLELFAHQVGFEKPAYGESVIGNAVYAFMVVASIEELSKFGVLRFFAYPKDAFNEPFDGITYSVMVSMGFATLENLMYVTQGGLAVAVVRMFLAVPAHATFAVLMGFFVGLAKFRNNSVALQLLGLVTAVLFHGAYDFFLFMNHMPLLILGAIGSLLTGVILSFRAVRIHAHNSPFKNKPAVEPAPINRV